MSIPKNSKEIINSVVKGEWYFLTKRTDIPILPVWLKMKSSSVNLVAKKIYGNFIPWADFWHNNECEFYIHGNEFRNAVLETTKLLYSYKKASAHLLKTASLCKDARDAAREFYEPDWKKYNSEQLLETYSNIVEKYTLSFIYGFLTWCTQVLQFDSKKIIEKYKKQLLQNGISTDEALGILITSDISNLYKEKELFLDKLSKIYKKFLKEPRSQKYIANKFPELDDGIKSFL